VPRAYHPNINVRQLFINRYLIIIITRWFMRNKVRPNEHARTYHNIRELTRWRTVKLNRFEVLTCVDIQKSAGHVSLLLVTKCGRVKSNMEWIKKNTNIRIQGEPRVFFRFSALTVQFSIKLKTIGNYRIIYHTIFFHTEYYIQCRIVSQYYFVVGFQFLYR